MRDSQNVCMMNRLQPFKWAGSDSEYAPLARPRSEIAARWRTDRDHAALVGRAMQCRWLVCVLCAGSVMWAMEWPTRWPEVDVSWPELDFSSPASLLSLPTVTLIWPGQPDAQAQSWRGQHAVTSLAASAASASRMVAGAQQDAADLASTARGLRGLASAIGALRDADHGDAAAQKNGSLWPR